MINYNYRKLVNANNSKGDCKMSEKEIAAKLYWHWYEVNEHTKKRIRAGKQDRYCRYEKK